MINESPKNIKNRLRNQSLCRHERTKSPKNLSHQIKLSDRWKCQKESRRVPVAGKYWSCNCRHHNVKLLEMAVVPTTSSDLRSRLLARPPARFTAIPDIFGVLLFFCSFSFFFFFNLFTTSIIFKLKLG